MAQFKTWLVCQFCGRVTTPEESEHWLNQPHRERLGIRVVRCPEHWSEWALRHTREGRTKENRKMMAEALRQPVSTIPAHVGPFPTTERDDPVVSRIRLGR